MTQSFAIKITLVIRERYIHRCTDLVCGVLLELERNKINTEEANIEEEKNVTPS